MREVGVDEDNKYTEEEELGAAIISVDFSGKCLCVKVCQSPWQEFFDLLTVQKSILTRHLL